MAARAGSETSKHMLETTGRAASTVPTPARERRTRTVKLEKRSVCCELMGCPSFVLCDRSGRDRPLRGFPLDALENLPKECSGQVAFGKLQREVPGVADQPPAGFE